MICWSCEREGGDGALCVACGALQPPDAAADHFAVLGLPRGYGVDLAVAETAYKRLSRQVHPDRFATADPRARKASLARTVQLNDAWRTLRDPVRRAEYMLAQDGIDVTGEGVPPGGKPRTPRGGKPRDEEEARATRQVAAPPAFLMEMLELHEELRDAQRGGNAPRVAAIAADMRARSTDTMTTLAAALDHGPGGLTPAGRDQATRALVALRYYRRFLDEIEAHEQRADDEATKHG